VTVTVEVEVGVGANVVAPVAPMHEQAEVYSAKLVHTVA
jgi:hypothetical protein